MRMLVLALFGAAITVAAGLAGDAAVRRTPVLLELFTSEGCSSCPPADQLLRQLDSHQPIEGAELIVLSEHVDYWNGLGWKDPYSSAQFTARQQDYSNKYGFDGVYTPQLAIDGRVGLVGSDGRRAVAEVQRLIHEPKLPLKLSQAARSGNSVIARVELPAANGLGNAVLYVALAESQTESKVARGENSGRKLAHVAVTRVLQSAGTISLKEPVEKEITLTVPQGAGTSGLRVVAFLQDPRSGHILGVAEKKL